MRLKEIKEKVLNKELLLQMSHVGTRSKRKYIWKDDKIERVETIKWEHYNYRAVFLDDHNRGFRIPKKVYNELIKELVKK